MSGRRSPNRSGPSWGLTAVLVIVTAFLTILGPQMSQYLPASLLVSRTDQELQQQRSTMLATAKGYEGTPYLYGGTNPSIGVDCSGFVIATLRTAFNIGMPSGVRTAAQMSTVGDVVTKEQLQPGDLVFFRTDPSNPDRVGHVAIYAGNDTIIHANSYAGRVMEDRLFGSSYFAGTYYGARRIIGVPPGTTSPAQPDPSAPSPEAYQVLPISDASITGSAPNPGSSVSMTAPAPAPTPTPTPTPAPAPVAGITGAFPDVSSSLPGAASITLLKERGVIGGYDDGTFKPRRTVSRVELLKFAFKAYAVPVSAQDPVFGDIPSDHWGRGYIATAYANGWVSGYGNGDFGPDNPVTRAEAAKILFKVGGLPYDERPITSLYADTGRDTWMAPFAAVVKQQKLMDSFGVNFEPNLGMDRAAVAEFIVRALRWQGKA